VLPIPGIKVDLGAKEMAAFPGEKVTEGLDGLRARLAEYLQMGARFAKWRAVFAIGDGSQPWMHRGERTCTGPLRRVVSRSKPGSGPDGGRSHVNAGCGP
jgi:hypothetical protein